ncbi:unnamed protein product [Darwinula stevensoni]|uniref:SV2A/B/C luminal domain-containing protein n=1 Tax=Darwinula stevensoni TaxID=69355 RepID=A0A7R9A7I1_9CRUS|nr:unnamed protein product [Darwinula stevensoni]CAG0893510.1 unnamed protein product [Darwinula stevensoni]
MEQYDENSTVIQDQHFHGPKDNFYNTTVENIRYAEASFLGVNFTNVVLNHVVFDSCYLQDCKFTNILSSKTFFRNSTLIRPYFSDTDIYEYRSVPISAG